MNAENKKYPNFINILLSLVLFVVITFILMFLILVIAYKILHINLPDITYYIIGFITFISIIYFQIKKYSINYKIIFPIKKTNIIIIIIFFISLIISLFLLRIHLFNYLKKNNRTIYKYFTGSMGNLKTTNIKLGISIIKIIFVPLLEEMLFRGFILQSFRKNYSEKKSIILSSILYSLFFIYPITIFFKFIEGVFYSYISLKTNSLLPNIFTHSMVSVFAILLIYYQVHYSTKLFITAGFVFIISLIVLMKYFNKKIEKKIEV